MWHIPSGRIPKSNGQQNVRHPVNCAKKKLVLVLENVQSHVNTIQRYMFDVQEMLQCETIQQHYEKLL